VQLGESLALNEKPDTARQAALSADKCGVRRAVRSVRDAARRQQLGWWRRTLGLNKHYIFKST
jgi:hypothetical protein